MSRTSVPSRADGRTVLYLASTSPRRRRLLQDAGLDHRCVPPGPEPEGRGTPRDRAVVRARSKAVHAVVDDVPGSVLGVDTVVEIDGDELGKPGDAAEASSMIQRLAGRVHEVHTAHCLRLHPDVGRVELRVTSATVRFAAVDTAALRLYLDSGAWTGKAGAYGIQDPEAGFASLIEGDRDTVVGLSVLAVRELLGALGGEP